MTWTLFIMFDWLTQSLVTFSVRELKPWKINTPTASGLLAVSTSDDDERPREELMSQTDRLSQYRHDKQRKARHHGDSVSNTKKLIMFSIRPQNPTSHFGNRCRSDSFLLTQEQTWSIWVFFFFQPERASKQMLTLNTNEEIMMIKAQTPASFPLEVFIQVTSSC